MADSPIDIRYYLMLSAWLVGPVMLFSLLSSRNRLAGVMVYAYLLSFFVNHWMGAFVHALPGSDFLNTQDTVEGFQLSTLGMLALLAGALLVRTPRQTSRGWSGGADHLQSLRGAAKLSVRVGVLAWGATYTPVAALPSAASFLSAGKQFLLLGLCLFCWVSWQERKWSQFRMWIALSFLLPVITVVTSGFIGYGIAMLGTVLVFVAMFYRPRWIVLVALLASIYGGMSFWVVYAASRDEIRAAVWGGRSLETRGEVVLKVFQNLAPINFADQAQLQHIEDRLNQNWLIGAAIRTTPDLVPFVYGRTILDAIIGIIPRAIWPDKPATGGSGKYVSQHTMITFAESTSVGMGQVFEFYINFGTTGVVVGFLLLGMALRWIDIRFTRALQSGDVEGCILFFLVGGATLQSGGALSEVVASAGGGAVLAILINRYLRSRNSGRATDNPFRKAAIRAGGRS